ncbi:MAG TPA: STAS domain-containing protein [Candidatus Limnocylindrales bacterium]|nr:STAS domain-containing protein [Candidatus Limnocylindrales bacterium]
MPDPTTDVAALLEQNQDTVLRQWQTELERTSSKKISTSELHAQTREFLQLLTKAIATGTDDLESPSWSAMRDFLEDISRSRCLQGFSSSETATFLFSLKKPLFDLTQRQYANAPGDLAATTWRISTIVDDLGLYTVRSYQRTREDVIQRQQLELLELSTPVVKLWDGVLALPMIGTLDSSRTQVVMESLLQRIVDTGSELAIIDITGVPTVDTLVAQHLLKTVTAIRLMGADCIVSGVRPQIAQTIVHLGVDLQGVVTKSTLADALALALRRVGYTVTRNTATRRQAAD